VADIDAGDFSRWLSSKKPGGIGEEKYLRLVSFLAEENRLPVRSAGSSAHDAFEYAGIAAFLNAEPARTADIAAHYSGHYEVFRYSNHKPGLILRGALEIAAFPNNRGIKTSEKYQIIIELPRASWSRIGYLLPRGERELMMVSKKPGTVEVQIIYWRSPIRVPQNNTPGEAVNMDGVLVDWQGDKLYSTRIYARKLNKPLAESQIHEMLPSKVASNIREIL